MKKTKVLITGGTGFIGSHLTELFVKKGYSVTCFDRYNPNYNLGCLEGSKFKNDINFVFGDIRDYDSVHKVIKNSDIVLHLAALIGIPYSYFSPLAYVKTNVVSAAQLFSEIKQHDHPLNIGYNSKNRFLSRWMWYLKNLLPNKLGGFKNIKYE